MRKFKLIIPMILLTIIFSSVGWSSTEKEEVSLSSAIEKAISHSGQIDDIEDQIESLEDSLDEIREGQPTSVPVIDPKTGNPIIKNGNLLKAEINFSLEEYQSFERLYEKKEDGESLSALNRGMLSTYKKFYGEEPNWSNTRIFETLIEPTDFTEMTLESQLDQLKAQKDLTPEIIASQVRSIYQQILDLEDNLNAQKIFLEISNEQLKNDEAKYDQGQISKIDLIKSQNSYKEQKLSYEKLQRSHKILKMTFKDLCNIPLDSSIKLISKMSVYRTPELKDYKIYQQKALENRIEVINAKKSYNLALKKSEIAKKYLRQDLLTKRIEYDMAALDSKNEFIKAKEDVQADIRSIYFQVKSAIESYELSKEKLVKSTRDFSEKKKLYNAGMMTETDFKLIKFQYEMAKVDYYSKSRQLNLKMILLNNAINLGPGDLN